MKRECWPALALALRVNPGLSLGPAAATLLLPQLAKAEVLSCQSGVIWVFIPFQVMNEFHALTSDLLRAKTEFYFLHILGIAPQKFTNRMHSDVYCKRLPVIAVI